MYCCNRPPISLVDHLEELDEVTLTGPVCPDANVDRSKFEIHLLDGPEPSYDDVPQPRHTSIRLSLYVRASLRRTGTPERWRCQGSRSVGMAVVPGGERLVGVGDGEDWVLFVRPAHELDAGRQAAVREPGWHADGGQAGQIAGGADRAARAPLTAFAATGPGRVEGGCDGWVATASPARRTAPGGGPGREPAACGCAVRAGSRPPVIAPRA